jgi:hypothetical protein
MKKNIQHSTFNMELPMMAAARTPWALGVECWALNVSQLRTIRGSMNFL